MCRRWGFGRTCVPGLTAAILVIVGAAMRTAPSEPEAARAWTTKVPHDSSRWTEGLTCSGGKLFESTGMWGFSRIYSAAFPPTGDGTEVVSPALPTETFGEGIVVADGEVLQFTYQSGQVWRYDAEHLQVLGHAGLPLLSQAEGPPGATSRSQAPALHHILGEDAGLVNELAAALGLMESSSETGEGPLLAAGVSVAAGYSMGEVWGATIPPHTHTGSAHSPGCIFLSDGTMTLHVLSRDGGRYVKSLPVVFATEDDSLASASACSASGSPSQQPQLQGLGQFGGGDGTLRLNELEYLAAASLEAAYRSGGASCSRRPTLPRKTVWGERVGLSPAEIHQPIRTSSEAQAASNETGCVCDDGDEVWAAVAGCVSILRINACTGIVLGWIHFPPLHPTLARHQTEAPFHSRSRRSWRAAARGGGQQVLQPTPELQHLRSGTTGSTEDGLENPSSQAAGTTVAQAVLFAEDAISDLALQHSTAGDMNGIALCGVDTIAITGKNWQWTFLVPLSRLICPL